MQNSKHVQLVRYRFGKGQQSLGTESETMAKQVYVIKCSPKVVPVDINVQWLVENGWNSSLDRLRMSADQLFIRRFDPAPSKDSCVVVQMTSASDPFQLTIYANDEEMAELYFRKLFLGNHLDVTYEDMNVFSRGWMDNPHDLYFYCGTVHAAFGLWGSMLVEMQLNSLSVSDLTVLNGNTGGAR